MPRDLKLCFVSIFCEGWEIGKISCGLAILLSAQLISSNIAIAVSIAQLSLPSEASNESSQSTADRYLKQGIERYQESKYSQAIKFWNQALKIYRDLGNHTRENIVLGNLGIAHKSTGQYAKAISYHKQALNIGKVLGHEHQVGTILDNLGNTYAAFGEYDQALNYHKRSLALAQKIGDRSRSGIVLANLGATYFDNGDITNAIKHYLQSLLITQELGNRKIEGYTLTNLGSAYHVLGNFSKALDYYQRGLKIANEIGDRWLKAEALASLGLVSESLQDFDKAIDYYDQGFVIFQSIGAKQEQATTLNNQAHTLLKFGKYPEAEEILRQAIRILDNLRDDLDQASQIAIFDIQVLTFNLLQQVLIAQNKPQAALEISEHGRARAFVNLLSQRQTSKSESIRDIAPPNLTQVRQIAHEQNATLVEYTIVPDDQFIHQGKQLGREAILYIWVVKPNGKIFFQQVDLSTINLSLTQLVAMNRESIGVRGRSSVAFTPPINSSQVNQHQQLRQLYKLLIQPISDVLPSDPQDRVIFIPQGSLFLIPFPALLDEQGTYLIEKHTIQTAPAIQVLQLTHTALTEGENSTPLVVGNPKMPAVSTRIGHLPQQLSSLSGAEQEAVAVADLLKTEPILGAAATEITITSQLPKANIIHLATHGLLDAFPGQGVPGAIALTPTGNDSSNDGLLTASEILDLKLNAELVVLSACDTGRGEITGDGVIGLSRSWLAAGASSVLVSLWAVPDAPTATLMTEFYRNLQQNPDKAQALQKAMLTIMKQYPNPRDWAAFTLIGET